jgi:hypothetical protein
MQSAAKTDGRSNNENDRGPIAKRSDLASKYGHQENLWSALALVGVCELNGEQQARVPRFMRNWTKLAAPNEAIAKVTVERNA